jgi:hypothetical protein
MHPAQHAFAVPSPPCAPVSLAEEARLRGFFESKFKKFKEE